MAVPLQLNVFKGDALVLSRQFDRDIIKIGRNASAHLTIDDEKVSRIHSVIEVGADGALSIIDMGSVEGTYVNGKRVNRGALVFGDTITVGNTTIQVSEVTENLQAAAQAGSVDATHPGLDVARSLSAAAGAGDATHVGPAPVAPEPAAPAAEEPPPEVTRTEKNAALAAEPAPRARPERRKGKGPLGLEIRMMWGDQMVASHFLKPGHKGAFQVGSAEGVDFVMGDGKLGGASFVAVSGDGKQFSVRFTGKMVGELEAKGETITLQHVIESGRASQDGDAYALSLGDDDFAWVDLGGVRLEAFFQPVPKPVFVPLAESLDFTVINIFLVMFFLASLFVITAMNRSLEGEEYADELSGTEARIAKLIIKPPEVQKNPFLEKLQQQKEKKSGELAQKSRGDEGQAGSKTSQNKKPAHMAPKGDPSKKDQARALTQKIFGGSGGGLSQVFGSSGLGGQLKSAMGNMFGSAAGDAQGFGGLGLKGSSGGGGGVGDTIGIGAIGTKGRGGGTGAYGTGVGVLSGKKGVDIGITSSEPEVMGSLDKELIRQVIHRNRNQIRYCYESQLTRHPKLNGKVAVKFVISASGAVASSNVAQSTANNAELETCVAGRVRTWQFPKPKGGGVVIVTYPFIFKQSGE